jgi:hypothetical protein
MEALIAEVRKPDGWEWMRLPATPSDWISR